MPTIHVIGAGVSGLACATRAVMSGVDVAVYEAAGHAGGRARSFHDESLGCMIDNGNHLLLGANEATQTYLADIDAQDRIREIRPAAFPFLDLKSGKRWRVRPAETFRRPGFFRETAGSPIRDRWSISDRSISCAALEISRRSRRRSEWTRSYTRTSGSQYARRR